MTGPVGGNEARQREALVALGANLAFAGFEPAQTITAAAAALSKIGHVRARSGLWSSPAWPDASKPPYVNAVVRLRTALSPVDLLVALGALETAYGRARSADPWADRTLDLDIVDYDGQTAAGPAPILPHPRACERAFVLLPLRDVAPLWRPPGARSETLNEFIGALDPEQRRKVQRIA